MRFFTIYMLLISSAFATPLPYKKLVTTFSGGPGWAQPFQALVVSHATNPYAQVSLYHQNTQTLGFGELFISAQYPFYNEIQGQFGAAISGAGNATSNVIDQSTIHTTQNSYELVQYRIAFRGKWFAELKHITPYITASVGGGFTAMTPNNSLNINKNSIQVIDNNAYSIPYTFGIGFQHALNSHWTYGIGYEYYNWGNADVNLIPTAYHKTYNLNLLSMNSLIFSISYRDFQ